MDTTKKKWRYSYIKLPAKNVKEVGRICAYNEQFWL
jgi:hypothetical protein